jgi:hypothetical protein
MTRTLTLARIDDQRWLLISGLESIQAGDHRVRVCSRLHVHAVRAALRTVIEQTPFGAPVATPMITPFPVSAVSFSVLEHPIPESTSEAGHGTLIESPQLTTCNCLLG